MKPIRVCVCLLAVLILTCVGPFDPARGRPLGFSFDEHLLVPVRVHLLRAKDSPDANTRLTPADIDRIFAKVQTIWHQAGIHLVLESVLEEEAEDPSVFQENGEFPPLPSLRRLRPMKTRLDAMFHVYYLRRFSVNGVYLDRASIFVQDTARLRRVEGGIDEPIPRVTAHELGHGLGLPHRQDTFNLMASGTTGTLLNEDEIETARRTAKSLDWVETPAKAAMRADGLWQAGKRDQAKRKYEVLLRIPGDSDLKALAMMRLKES